MRSVVGRLVLILFVVVSAARCAVAVSGERNSPWSHGLDFRLSPELRLGEDEEDGPVTVHPTVAYERQISFGGANVFHLGGQVRYRPAAQRVGGRQLWFGGEAAYVRWTSGGFSANGSRYSGLVGVPVYEHERGTAHVYGAVGLSRFGSNGMAFRVGIEFWPKSGQ
jgi:hypothetical protein